MTPADYAFITGIIASLAIGYAGTMMCLPTPRAARAAYRMPLEVVDPRNRVRAPGNDASLVWWRNV